MENRLVNDCAIEKDDVFFAVGDLGSVVPVRPDLMRSEMPVDDRVVSVRFVKVLRRERRRQHEIRGQDEPGGHAKDEPQHKVIIATSTCGVKRGAATLICPRRAP